MTCAYGTGRLFSPRAWRTRCLAEAALWLVAIGAEATVVPREEAPGRLESDYRAGLLVVVDGPLGGLVRLEPETRVFGRPCRDDAFDTGLALFDACARLYH